MTIQTNRDLYLAIATLIQAQKHTTRSLEAYLRSLWLLAAAYQTQPKLTVSQFLELITQAFEAHVPAFVEAWRQIDDEDDMPGYPGWQATILRQIVDLHEMDEQGILKDRYKYLGVNSPGGRRWYNFDSCTFLECAMAGTYGGWQAGDETGRLYVPGKVLAINKAGHLEEQEPDEMPNPVYPLTWISWDNFQEFLQMGQLYE